jgi:hypothetical protein
MPVGFWWENQREKDHYEVLDVDGKIILRWILKKQDGMLWTGFIPLGIGTSGGTL